MSHAHPRALDDLEPSPDELAGDPAPAEHDLDVDTFDDAPTEAEEDA